MVQLSQHSLPMQAHLSRSSGLWLAYCACGLLTFGAGRYPARRRPDASGLVLEATFTSVRDMIDESPWGFLPVGLILTQNFDTLAKLPELRMPVLVSHGTEDRIVPFHMGERLYEAVKGPKRFIKVEGGSHHNLSGAAFDEYRQALRELFGLKSARS